VGSLPALLRDPLGFFLSAPVKYGEVYTIDLGLTRVIALNHPRHAQHVLRDNARNYGKGGALWDTIRGLVGNGLPASEGDLWRRQRRMMQPHFHKERLAAMSNHMLEAMGEALKPWEEAADSGEPFNVVHALTQLTLKVIVKTMLGADIAQDEASRIGSELAYSLDYMVRGMITNSLPDWLPVPGRKRFEDAVKTIDEITFRVVGRRRSNGQAGGDILGMLLDLVDADTGEGMSDQQLRDELISLVVAGYESSAMSLSFAIESLAQRPDIRERMRQEVDAALGQERLGMAHLPRLTLPLMVFQEALRLYPPAYWIMRSSIEDDVIDGYRIPGGTMIGVMDCYIHRRPDIWENPDTFDPWRFSPERQAGRHPLAWFPFGVGQRLCIGRDFALMEGQFLLASLISRFDFEPVPGRVTRRTLSTTLRPRDGVWVRLRRRER
jgi:cytochrome P450